MNRPSIALIVLICLYTIGTVLALWRAFEIQSLDLFTAGAIPVLIGLLMRTAWASLVLKIYIAIQTLGFTALGATAVIAYQITPEDVKVVFNGQNIPIPLIAAVVLVLLSFQWWVAFAQSTKQYLNPPQD